MSHISPVGCELTVTATYLPRCAACGGAHPLARRPAADPAACPDCGSPAGQPVDHQATAKPNLWVWVAHALANLARFVRQLAERL